MTNETNEGDNVSEHGIVRYDLFCRIFGHEKEYTEEYRNQNQHVQADKVCVRCGGSEVAWTGPTVAEIEETCNKTVPSKEKAYSKIGVRYIDTGTNKGEK